MSHEPSPDADVDDEVVPAALELLAPDGGTADTAVVATLDDGTADTAVVATLDAGPTLTGALLHAATTTLDPNTTTNTLRIPMC